MRKLIQLCSLSLAVVLCLGLFAGCTKLPSLNVNSAASSDTTSTPEPEPVTADAHEPGLFVDGQKVEADPMMTVNGKDVSFDMYRQAYLSTKSMFDGGDATVWEKEDAQTGKDTLLEYATSNILTYFAVQEIAAANKITITDKEREDAATELKNVQEQVGGAEAFQKALADQYYTQDLYLDLYCNSLLANKVIEQLYTDKIMTDVKENYVRAQHILVKFASAEKDADHSAEKKKAEEILVKVKAGDDFSKLMETYNEDTGEPAEGYYFTTGKMVKPFEDAAFALKDGETSAIVETDYGYHIIKRLPMEDAYITKNLTSLMSDTLKEEFSMVLDAAIKKLTVTYSEAYKQVAPDTMF